MTARKSAPEAKESTPQDSAAEGVTQEPTPEPSPVPAPESAPESELAHEPRHAAPEPVRHYKIPRPAPYRAGGHVLTERGWELDTGQCDTDQEA